MFEDIAQMEKEIETFRKNIAASSELVEGISQLTEATRQREESFSASTDSLIKRIDACILQIKEDHASALQALNNENSSTINTLQKNLLSEQSSRLAELERIKSELENMQASYAEKLTQTELIIKEYQKNAEQQYNDFVHRLETTNVDQIFKEVQELKQSMNVKFGILMGGIGITLVVSVLSYILK